MTAAQSHIKTDSNWMVPAADQMRAELRDLRLQGVCGVEARTMVKAEIALMDWNELNAALRAA